MTSSLAVFFDQLLEQGGHGIVDLVRLSGGASRETFAFGLMRPGGTEPELLIMQRARAGSLSASVSMVGEAALLRSAAGVGVRVAPVVAASDDPAIVGASFIVMERIDGETIARRILRDDRYAEARRVVVSQAAEALARIHALPVDAGPHLKVEEPLTQLRGLLDAFGGVHPAFELAFRWLDAHRPAADGRTPAIVHGDFRLGNLIVDDRGLAAVLDWELAHVGDPVEDLGWFCVRAWRFGAAPTVAGMGTVDELLDAYHRAGGRAVSPEELRWWEVLGTVRWGIICIVQASAHLTGASRSVELATIGRRVCENEYDALRLIAGDALVDAAPAPVGTDADAVDTGPHDAPTAVQLVEAVREFLERDVMEATTGRVQFHTRVAVNALAIVERELGAGATIAPAHRARLDVLGCHDEAELAQAIRAGRFDDRLAEVTQSVYDTVCDKLRVANPGYMA